MKKFLGIITIVATIIMAFCLVGCSDSSSTDEGITANDYYKLLLNNNSSCRWNDMNNSSFFYSWTFERQSDGGVTATYSTDYTAGYIPDGFRGRVSLDFDPSATPYILDNWQFKIEGIAGNFKYIGNEANSSPLPYIFDGMKFCK